MNIFETPKVLYRRTPTSSKPETGRGHSDHKPPCSFPPGHLIIAFLAGSMAYPLLEIAFRGHSHWTMALAGGLCFSALFAVQAMFGELAFWRKALLGTITIVLVELSIGTVANLWLGWDVWDYTNLRFHYLGQISLLFALIWFLLCSVFFRIAEGIYKKEKRG